jgi:hypothetical protein
MGKIRNRHAVWLAMLGLCGVGSISGAFASPPSTQKAALRLDLRPSLELRATANAMGAPEKNSEVFPSSLHRQTLGSQEQLQLPNLGSESSQLRMTGGAQEFAKRVHREGLPVARLWENKSALVSIGLNQKGKPGLWLTQKTH